MYLSRITLENFRGFENAVLDLDPHLTVLVGPNGSGKSSLLRAIDLAASQTASDTIPGLGIGPVQFDLRVDCEEARVSAEWQEPAYSLELTITRDSASALASSTGTGVRGMPAWLYFGPTDRSRLRADVSPAMGSHGRLSVGVSGEYAAWSDDRNRDLLPFERFWGWYEKRENDENAMRVRAKDFELQDPALAFIRQAVVAVMGGSYADLRTDRERFQSVVLSKNGVDFAIEQLSDGERSLLVLTTAIARRLALFATDKGQPVDQPATVLIDEIEQHLHGRWQREVLPRLRRAFPNVQFVVTTHSPIVLSAVEGAQVRVLEDFKIYSGPESIYGRDANALFEDVFGVPRRPQAVQEQLTRVADLIDNEDLAGAKAQLEKLSEVLGEDDAEVVHLRVMADLLDEPPQVAAGDAEE